MISHDDCRSALVCFELHYNATNPDIKSRYRELSLKFHPDKGGTTTDFQEVKKHYDVLISKEFKDFQQHEEKVPIVENIPIVTIDEINAAVLKGIEDALAQIQSLVPPPPPVRESPNRSAKRKYRCSQCADAGHNVRTCPERVAQRASEYDISTL